MKVLLDTNAYSALMVGDESVARLVRSASVIFLSTVVVGELQAGFRHGSRFERNQQGLESFLSNPFVHVIDVSLTTADRFGRITAALRAKGRPIPTNDIWIAAHALETGSDLVSFDEHFAHVDGLVHVRPL